MASSPLMDPVAQDQDVVFETSLRPHRLSEFVGQDRLRGNLEVLVKAARRGWRIVELPVRYRPRIGGQSKISGTLKGTLLAAYYILWTIFRYACGRGR